MASLSGILHRPLSAATAVVVAAVSSDLSDIFSHPKSTDSAFFHPLPKETSSGSTESLDSSWVPRISFSNLSFMSSTQNPVREFTDPPSSLSSVVRPKSLFTSSSWPSASPHPLPNLHQYTNLSRTQAIRIISTNPSSPSSSSSEEVSYRWHLPDPGNQGESGRLDCPTIRSQTVVVLLGWLGAKQKHLKKYADWYTSRGFHVVTFTLPMADILSYKVGEKAERDIAMLASHLTDCVGEDHGKNLIFHTFSNTGWMMYGVILENFQKQDPSLMDKIKCCVVDSAPVAAPDPQVWASGFSAAILKKQSSSSKATAAPGTSGSSTEPSVDDPSFLAEVVLLEILERVFKVVLNLPPVNRRLADVFEVLSSRQPRCPQLYVYSSSDRVIPASSVESFMEAQKKAGHEVRAHNFVSSPHVDHFRTHPSLYTSHLTAFLDDCVLTSAGPSS